MRDNLKSLLEAEGFTVNSCASGMAGIDLAKRNNIGTFLVDYKMPQMNGAEVTVVLRTLYPKAVIIGFSMEPREKSFLRAGADKFINKDELDDKLIRYLNERSR